MSDTESVEAFRRANHYVPKTYLKHWGGTDGRVWVYPVLVSHPNMPLWKLTSIKGLAYHTHLYTRVVATGLTDEIERWLDTDFESPAGEVIQKVVANARLRSQDWTQLIRFLAAQDVRTPARLMEFLQRCTKTLPDIMNETLRESIQEFTKLKREGKPVNLSNHINAEYLPIKITTETVPGEKDATLRAEAVVGRGLWLFSLKQLLTNTVNVLTAQKWTILRSPEGIEWLTSDDPVIRLNYHNPEKYNFGGGWGSKGTEILLPLSPRHLLYAKIGSRPPPRGTVISIELARQFQRFTVEHAHRLIIATTEEKSVLKIRPRIVDSAKFESEAKQWKHWHEEQIVAERSLQK